VWYAIKFKMLHQEIIDKNRLCYVLLSSHNEPNILIPGKAIVRDIKFSYNEPQYLVELVKFYDTITFLKTYLFNMIFYKKFNRQKEHLHLTNISTMSELTEHLKSNKITVVSHSLMTFQTKTEMNQTFNKLNDYFIQLHLSDLSNNLTRSFYTGNYNLKGKKVEFFKRLHDFMGDKFPTKDGISYDEFITDMRNTAPVTHLKYNKIKK